MPSGWTPSAASTSPARVIPTNGTDRIQKTLSSWSGHRRPAAAVHFDPVNMINSPELIYDNGKFLRHCFEVLGPFIEGIHAKDIILRGP